MFTKPELLGYVDWRRGRVRQTLDALTEELAARQLPSAHRYHGMLFGLTVGSVPLDVVEHASQIRQFLTAAGVKVQPMPGDRGYTGDPWRCQLAFAQLSAAALCRRRRSPDPS